MTADSVLMAAAKKRAARYVDLGDVYKITTSTFSHADTNTVRVIANAANGDAITIRIVARYGVERRKVTNVFASSTVPGAHNETPIVGSQIALWFQSHSTHAPFLRRPPAADTPEPDNDSTSSVYRSDIDDRVWMCNIPNEDVAGGIQCSTSLRKVQRYVEDVATRNGLSGVWVQVGPEHWQHRITDES